MSALRHDFSADIPHLVDTLDRDGFACLENVVDSDWLAQAQADVNRQLGAHGARYFTIRRPADEAGTAADRFVHDPHITALMRDLTEATCPRGVVESEDIYSVLRIIAGPRGSKGSHEFHYDASVVTMLVPLFMPRDGIEGSGALVTIPNRRPYRKSVAANLVEKVITQNRFYQRYVAKGILARPERFAHVLYPGNLYLFWGYRTYHGNLACIPDSKRATLLLHYGNPHGNSAVLRLIRQARKMFEVAKLKLG
jgi:hypothetical protein